LGATAVAISVWVWRAHPAFRAMAVSLLVSVVQLGIGVGLLARTDKQIATLRADLAREPAAARATELTRMERVNRSFKWVEALEAVLIVAALVMVFNVFAEHRAHAYTSWLRG
jgi:hypothetical protein